MKIIPAVIIFIAMICLFSANSFAVSQWDVNASGDWTTNSNWLPALVPGAAAPSVDNADTANFWNSSPVMTAPITVTVDEGRNIQFISFGNTTTFGYTLQTGTLVLTNGGTVETIATNGNHTDTINSAIAIQGDGGAATFTAGATSATSLISIGAVRGVSTGANTTTLTLNGTNTGDNAITGVISNGGTGKLAVSKSGTGTWVLSGANTYTGSTTISAGTLKLGASGVISDSSAVVMSGGTLNLNGYSETIGSLSGTSNVTSGAAGSITLTTGGDGSSTSYSGVIANGSGTVALTKEGAGTFTVSGTNTYTGDTTIKAGTLKAGGAAGGKAFGTESAVTLYNEASAILDLNDFSQTIGSLSGGGAAGGNITLGSAILTVQESTDTTYSGIISETGGFTKQGTGTLTLTGTNTFTGTPSIGGPLSVNTIGLAGVAGNIGAGATMFFYNGTLQYTGATATTDRSITSLPDGTAAFEIYEAATTLTISGATGNVRMSLIKTGPGTLRLTGNNLHRDGTTVNEGILSLGRVGGTLTSAVTVSGGTLDVDEADTVTAVILSSGTISGDSVLTGTSYSMTDSGTVSAVLAGAGVALTKTGSGTLTLSGANTYSGLTNISAGTLAVSNADAVGTGALTNSATLNLGTIALNVAGVYTQNPAAILKLTIDTIASFGKIVSLSNAVVDSTSKIDITVNASSLARNAQFTIINGAGGLGVSVPETITSSNPRIQFIGSTLDGDLILTVSRSGFADAAANANELAAANVLDNMTNASSDMTAILNELSGLTDAEIANALNSMLPDINGAVLEVGKLTIGQLMDAVLAHQAYLRDFETGISTGSEVLKGIDVWAQGYGSYIHQAERQLSKGYNASIWGTALGFDMPVINDMKFGSCFGFAQDYIRGKDNSNRNNVNSYQWTIYGEYSRDLFYLDLAGSFAYNTYDASRQVAVGSIRRMASADYDGQQYVAYAEAGYNFNYKKLEYTPMVSFQYQHLSLGEYTESGAGSMDLTVKAQDYNLAQTGFGMKLGYPLFTKYGRLLPEIRFMWLYDWIGDHQQTTSTFAGGGGSFATNGFDPAQSSWDFGTKLTMFTKKNWTLAVNYDLEIKEDFYRHYGYVDAKYSF